MLNTEARICIVGAGAAGLSAAWYLRKCGYSRITILEKSPRVGGKCRSLKHEGALLELGAVLLLPSYRHVLAVAAELGMATDPVQPFQTLRRADKSETPRSVGRMVLGNQSIPNILGSFWRLLLAYRRHAAVLRRPGFAGMSARGEHADLAKPFAQWASDHGIAARPFELVFHLFGYGDPGPVPTAYALRYVSADFYLGLIRSQFHHFAKGPLRRMVSRWPRRLRDGFGELAVRMARGVDIRTDARIEAIHRDSVVTVAWSEPTADGRSRREETFDRLILACPPAATGEFMDQSAAEARLFSLPYARNYALTVCETAGIPATAQFFEMSHGPGDLIGLWKPAESTACVFYTNAVRGDTAAAIVTRLRTEVPRIHPEATLGPVIDHVNWDYFPQVDVDVFANGYFDDFEALQGQRATWYCGALLAFEAVENVFAYSEALVERMVTSGAGP